MDRPRTLQKAQYVGFSESAQPLQVAYFGWPRFPVPGSAPRTGGFCFRLSVFQLFASWPLEQRALGLLLAGGEFDNAPKEAQTVLNACFAGEDDRKGVVENLCSDPHSG